MPVSYFPAFPLVAPKLPPPGWQVPVFGGQELSSELTLVRSRVSTDPAAGSAARVPRQLPLVLRML